MSERSEQTKPPVATPSSEAATETGQAYWMAALKADDARPPSLRKPLLAAALAVSIGFGGFLLWGFTADLDSAAVATGKVIVDSKRKTISHLEGGILRRLLVQEGDFVDAGQPLVELDDTRARAELAQLHGKGRERCRIKRIQPLGHPVRAHRRHSLR